MLFSNTYHHIVDDGGRVALPSEHYDVLKRGQQPDILHAEALERRGLKGQIYRIAKLTPSSVLQTRADKRNALIENDDDRDAAGEEIFAEVKGLDIKLPQLRMTLPPEWLRQRKSKTPSDDEPFLDKEVSFVGVGEVIELWNTNDWKEYRHMRHEARKAQKVGTGSPGD